jgi:hypothetical protein
MAGALALFERYLRMCRSPLKWENIQLLPDHMLRLHADLPLPEDADVRIGLSRLFWPLSLPLELSMSLSLPLELLISLELSLLNSLPTPSLAFPFSSGSSHSHPYVTLRTRPHAPSLSNLSTNMPVLSNRWAAC